MKQFLLLLFCVCRLTQTLAQAPAYIHYGVREGLPGNLVYCGLQDRRGLLWFGTDKGLACFDGVRFRTFGLSEGLPDLEVLAMKEDRKGRIWLSCFRKRPCYMYNGCIYTEKQDTILSKLEFPITSGSYTVSEDAENRLWFFLGGKVYYINSDWNKVNNLQGTNWITTLQKVEKDYLFFSGRAFARFITVDSTELLFYTLKRRGLPFYGVIKSHILRSYAEKTELFEWKDGHITLVDVIDKPSGQVYADQSGQFWICTPAAGAVCFQNQQQNLTNPIIYLPGKKMRAMFEDTQGTKWFCTSDEGIYGLPKNAALNFQSDFFQSKNIRCIARNTKGHLLVGDDIGNVHIINGLQKETITFGSVDGYNLIRQIIPTGRDTVWIATDEGIYLYSGKSTPPIHYNYRESMKSILPQKDVIIFAAPSRLGYIRPIDQSEHLIIKKRYTALSADSEGNAWAGNMDGIYSQADSFTTNWGDRFPELKSKITNIQKAAPGRLWVVTPENGLLRATTLGGQILNVETLNKHLNKPILNIQSIFTEPDGTVWMATNKGVYGLNLKGQVWHFDSFDGLADDDVNCVLVDQDTIWVGTVSGLSKLVKSSAVGSHDYATFISALTYITNTESFSLNLLDSLNEHREIVLGPDAKNIELQLAGLDYSSRGNLHFDVEQNILPLPFYYWTAGNLTSWIAASLNNFKNISHVESQSFSLGAYLPPGRYQIRVTAVNASGQYSKQPDTWVFLKQPHWYELIWFYLLILSLLVAGIRQYYKARIAFREANASASTLQLQALQGQMNPHFIGNSINAIQQFLHPPDPIKASEYISLFTRLLRRTMLFSEQTFIPFSEELQYCREYFKMVHLRFEDKFNYEIIGAEQVNPNTLIPSMLLQPFLENATIHGLAQEEDSYIELRFEMDREILRCTLTDNGLGFKETQRLKQLSGLKRDSKGLEVLRKKIYALNRLYNLDLSLDIRDRSDAREAEHGTRVTLTFTPEKIWKATKAQSETRT